MNWQNLNSTNVSYLLEVSIVLNVSQTKPLGTCEGRQSYVRPPIEPRSHYTGRRAVAARAPCTLVASSGPSGIWTCLSIAFLGNTTAMSAREATRIWIWCITSDVLGNTRIPHADINP
jgi:hypothetical protein